MLNNLHFLLLKVDSAFQWENHVSLLKPDAVKKVKSYHFYKDQVMAFASELVKSHYIADYLQVSPQQLDLAHTSKGRPYLINQPNFDFNLSHSGDYLFLGIAKMAMIGVDIEQTTIKTDIDELASIAFSSQEQPLVKSQALNFLKLWTKKEALIKMLGIGFSTDYYSSTNLSLADFEKQQGILFYTSMSIDGYVYSISLKE